VRAQGLWGGALFPALLAHKVLLPTHVNSCMILVGAPVVGFIITIFTAVFFGALHVDLDGVELEPCLSEVKEPAHPAQVG